MTRKEAIERLKAILEETTSDEDAVCYVTSYDADALDMAIKALEQEPKIGRCKECKYFEYDSVAKVDGIPLIVAHEICKRWGDGCKTKEDGYCFLYEQQKREDEE